MKKLSQFISALMTLAIGILFIILKAEVVSICITIIGIALIVTAVLDFIKLKVISGIIKAILAAVVLLLGWTLIDIALQVLGIVLLIFGIIELVKTIALLISGKSQSVFGTILGVLEPIVCIIAAIFLITSKGEAIDLTVIIAGIFFIIDGILGIIRSFLSKKNKK